MIVRAASNKDIESALMLLLEHGPNEWNYLPPDEMRKHVGDIASGKTEAILAEDNGSIIGMATFVVGDFYPQFESEAEKALPRGYIAEVVVHRDYAGRGIGARLLEEVKRSIREKGIKTIYIKRHEENLASAGMMRKAGFQIVDTFLDPIRTTGSKKTTVERIRFED